MHAAQPELQLELNDIVLLARTGRLASWHRLTDAERQAATDHHVDLMVRVAAETGMRKLDGYRLMTPMDRFERFWVMAFSDLAGAESWIAAEMQPPYGLYGYYEYDLARPMDMRAAASLVQDPLPREVRDADPRDVPSLAADRDHVAVVCFGRSSAALGWQIPEPALPAAGSSATGGAAYRLLEGYRLMSPRADWQYTWLCAADTMDAAEAWIDAQTEADGREEYLQRFLLARRWQPDYFSSWMAGGAAS